MGNVVLVHGAWVDGSSWGAVIPLLLDAGHRVIAVQNPTTSLEADVAATRKTMRSLDGPKVLVGQSYGGTVISAAASGAGDVTGLVFVCALANEQGESVNDISARHPATEVNDIIKTDDDGLMTLDIERYPEIFASDVEPGLARVMAAVQQPLSAQCFDAKLDVRPAWKDLPSWYVRSTEDRVLHPDAQAELAERAGSKLIDVPTGHASPASRPMDVADAILEAVG